MKKNYIDPKIFAKIIMLLNDKKINHNSAKKLIEIIFKFNYMKESLTDKYNKL